MAIEKDRFLPQAKLVLQSLPSLKCPSDYIVIAYEENPISRHLPTRTLKRNWIFIK